MAQDLLTKTKILIITNHSYMLYQFRKELIQALMKEHEVVLSMPFVGHEEDFKAMGIKCIDTPIDRRGMNPKTDLKLLHTYKRLMKEELPDLVITYSIKPNIYAGLVCRSMGIPYCANVQGLGTAFQSKKIAMFVTMLYKVALKKARTVFFENDTNAQEFINRNILKRDHITVLHGAGINLDKFNYVPYPSNDTFHFLYLGRIMKEKGIDELFSSIRRLKEDNESFILDLVGFFEDEYKDQVEELEKLGIVKFHGFQSDPRPFYSSSDAIVLPSYHEGMSNVLLEGASTGRPLITSHIPGCQEAVDDKVTGYLTEVKNHDDLYEKMKDMLHLTSSQREEMGKQGRSKMEREFDKKQVVKETINALKL